MWTHLTIFFVDHGDVAVLKGRDKIAKCVAGFTDMPDIGDFIRRSRRLAKIAIATPGTRGDFRRSVYKIAKSVAGFRRSHFCAGESDEKVRQFIAITAVKGTKISKVRY